MSGKSVEPVSEMLVEGPSVGHNVEVESSDMEVGGGQTPSSVMMADLVALILKFMVVISMPDYTIRNAGQKMDRLLAMVGEVNIPENKAQVRADVASYLDL